MRNPPKGKVVRISTELYQLIQSLRSNGESIGAAVERLIYSTNPTHTTRKDHETTNQ